MTTQTLATAMSEAFERGERPNGDTFRKLRSGSPEWMTDIAHGAHGDMMPDDWRYACIEAACDWIAENGEDADVYEFADGQVDAYNGRLAAWLGSHSSRAGYCDEARDVFGPADGIMEAIQHGQYMEALEVFGAVLEGLRSVADDEPDEDAA